MNYFKEKIKVAFIGFAEKNIPEEIIQIKLQKAKERMKELEFESISIEYVRDDPDRIDAEITIKELKKKQFDLLIVCVAGWIPTYTIIQITDHFREKPILLWGLAGYYKNNILHTTADQAGTSATRKVFEDLGYNFKYIYDTPESFCDIKIINDYAKASRAKRILRNSRLGMMGFRDMKLYDTLYDGISLRREIGPEVEFFEMLEISKKMDTLVEEKINKVINKIKNSYDLYDEIENKYIEKPVKLYMALKQKILDEKYDGISLIDVDGVKKIMGFTPALTFMLMADELAVCTIPENDTLGLVTQLIVKNLTGQIGAYLEFYEFFNKKVLAGVPDYVPSEIVDGNVKLMLNRFGKLDTGVLNISKIKTGDITLSRLVENRKKYAMHIVTGKAFEPSKWVEVGWDNPPHLPGLEIVLDVSVREFADKVFSQHYIISYGNNVEVLKDYCRLSNIDIII